MRPFRYLVRPLLFSRRRAPVRALSASPLTSLLGPLGSFFDVLTSVAARAQQRAPLHDSETRGGDAGAQRTAILEAALAHVSAQGWTMDALAAGADTLGLPAAATGLFPHGPVELVWYVMRHANETMSAALSSADLAALPLNERIAFGVRARLAVFAPYRMTWASAMALGAAPPALPETLRLLAIAADEIWWAAGDRSTDASWYSRRVLLMALSAAAETFMLTDRSADCTDTDAFVARRLEELEAVGTKVKDGASVVAAAGTGVGAVAAAVCEVLRGVR